MKYGVRIGERTFEVEVVGERVLIDGRAVQTELDAIPGTPLRRLVVDGNAHTLALGWEGDRWVVQRGGEQWDVRVVDERQRQLEALTGAGDASRHAGVVRAPMPGLVLRFEVEVGQTVEHGTGLVVLEAMKMENEIRSPGAGVVAEILVEPGQAVEKGAVLIEIAERLDAGEELD